MRTSVIVSAIEAKVATSPWDIWRIGLTQNLEEEKLYWENTERQALPYWSTWEAGNLVEAREIETEMILRGMKGKPGGEFIAGIPVFVFVF